MRTWYAQTANPPGCENRRLCLHPPRPRRALEFPHTASVGLSRLAALGCPKPDLQWPAITGPHGKAATNASTDQGGVKRRELPCGPIAFLGHADGIDGYCVLTWCVVWLSVQRFFLISPWQITSSFKSCCGSSARPSTRVNVSGSGAQSAKLSTKVTTTSRQTLSWDIEWPRAPDY